MKIIFTNLGIVLLYVVLTSAFPEFFLVLFLGFIPLHFIVLFILMIISFVQQKKEYGQAYLLSMLIMAVIGFSFCSM